MVATGSAATPFLSMEWAPGLYAPELSLNDTAGKASGVQPRSLSMRVKKRENKSNNI